MMFPRVPLFISLCMYYTPGGNKFKHRCTFKQSALQYHKLPSASIGSQPERNANRMKSVCGPCLIHLTFMSNAADFQAERDLFVDFHSGRLFRNRFEDSALRHQQQFILGGHDVTPSAR